MFRFVFKTQKLFSVRYVNILKGIPNNCSGIKDVCLKTQTRLDIVNLWKHFKIKYLLRKAFDLTTITDILRVLNSVVCPVQ